MEIITIFLIQQKIGGEIMRFDMAFLRKVFGNQCSLISPSTIRVLGTWLYYTVISRASSTIYIQCCRLLLLLLLYGLIVSVNLITSFRAPECAIQTACLLSLYAIVLFIDSICNYRGLLKPLPRLTK